MNDNLDDYILEHIDTESAQLSKLYRDAHVRLLRPRMLSGHLQGRVLKMLVRMLQPQRILEIGTYTGYATLCLAEGLPDNGEIHTLEKDDEMEDFIREQLAMSPDRAKIHLHIGNAVKMIPRLEGAFDFVFMDADKRQYCEYYDLVFDKVRKGGIIVADNTLWSGKILEPVAAGDRQTQGILDFNEKIKHDPRIEKVILPLRDGLTIIYKI
jgi:predicted O-methyltransferase YrrM